MKVKITRLSFKIKKVVSIEAPIGSKIICIINKWVTWYTASTKEKCAKIKTCHVDNFDDQRDVQSIEVSQSEFIKLGLFFSKNGRK